MFVLLLASVACVSSSLDTGDAETGGEDTAAADTSAPVDTGVPWWERDPSDADGDGWTAADGDCNDADAETHPGRSTDTCGAGDEDCDGQVDEDADASLDPHEPNDVTGANVGAMDDVDEQLVWGTLFPAGDVDRFRFSVEDGAWTWFSVEAWLYDVPADADYALALYWVADLDGADRGLVASTDAYGAGGYETLDYGGLPGSEDGGTYELVVTSAGGAPTCTFPYTLQILTGGW